MIDQRTFPSSYGSILFSKTYHSAFVRKKDAPFFEKQIGSNEIGNFLFRMDRYHHFAMHVRLISYMRSNWGLPGYLFQVQETFEKYVRVQDGLKLMGSNVTNLRAALLHDFYFPPVISSSTYFGVPFNKRFLFPRLYGRIGFCNIAMFQL